MKLTVDFNNVMSDTIGYEHGLRPEDIDALKDMAVEIHRDLQARRDYDIGFYNLPYDRRTLRKSLQLSSELPGRFDNLVVLGIGGSSLGARAIVAALCHPYHNLLPGRERKGLRIFFCDNIDPDNFLPILRILNPKRTLFNIITKSGATVETVAQFLIVKKMIEDETGRRYRDHIIVTTDPAKGDLRKIAEEEGFESLPVPQNVGGRYSAFSAVGLFPAAAAGVDIKKLLTGARHMDKLCGTSSLRKNPAYMSAVLNYLAYKRGKNISVIMPYSSALMDFAEWYVQLWAESLGKERNLKGEVVNCGPTPVTAIGTTDQHSQLQLFMEGPFDKIITFIEVKKFANRVPIPKIYKDIDGAGYLGGHTMEELFRAEAVSTKIALTKNRRMNYTISLPEINPFTIGQILFFFEVQTAFAGGLFEVNPFDQPGVEEGKKLTYGLMGKRGYEDKKEEIELWAEKERKYTI